MNKVIKLPCYGIVITLSEESEDRMGGEITSDLLLDEEENVCGFEDNGPYDMINAIESLILAHACAGIDVTTPAYIEGIETAVEKINNIC